VELGVRAGHRSREARLDGHDFDVPPAEHMLVISNDDRPGVIGTVGVVLGDAGINIADMDVGRVKSAGTAVMLLATTAEVPDEVVAALRSAPGILSVDVLHG
ncbi:MAG TPA: ACT domain-containing protein, partial [Ilumatobacter sp.]|nr:ACT domain-containing protein [Ilumatobacter sp.]